MTKETNQILLRLCISGKDNPRGGYTTDLSKAQSVFTLPEGQFDDKLYSIGSIIEMDDKEYVIKNISFTTHRRTNDYSKGQPLLSQGDLNPFNSTIYFDVEPK
jgi:hypothetical protein